MALSESIEYDKIEVVGQYKHVQVRKATVIKKDDVATGIFSYPWRKLFIPFIGTKPHQRERDIPLGKHFTLPSIFLYYFKRGPSCRVA